MKKFMFFPILLLGLSGCSHESYVAEVTYTVPEVKAQEEIKVPTENITINASGNYPVGVDFALSGKEKEFTIDENGHYPIGEEIPAGVYDMEAVSGNGSIDTGKDFIMMGVDRPENYDPVYKNIILQEGDYLTTSGVEIKFTPATGKDDLIPLGMYKINALAGLGTVQNTNIYEKIGVNEPDYYASTYEYLDLSKQSILTVDDVDIELIPYETESVIQNAVPAKAAYDVTEKIVIDAKNNELCYKDNAEVPCHRLEKREDLENDISEQKK